MQWRMSFVTYKEELKPGLIIFRRADVQHRNWYCRIKLPKADRYKTVSLKTASASDAREIAFDKYSEMRYAIKMGVPILIARLARWRRNISLNKPAVRRAARSALNASRKIQSVVNAQLNPYVGSTQVYLVG